MPTNTETYETHRQRIKQTLDQSVVSIAEIVRELDPPNGMVWSYAYVSGVLNGAEGKRSAPVLDAVEGVLRQKGEM